MAELTGPAGYANWRAIRDGAPHDDAVEYVLYSDACFTGEIADAGVPYHILNMVADDVGDVRAALTLRVEFTDQEERVSDVADRLRTLKKTDRSGFFGGELPDEIAALLSLEFRARIQAGEWSRVFDRNGDPRGHPVAYGGRRARPFNRVGSRPAVLPGVLGTRALEPTLLDLYPALPPENAIILLRAARSYQEAIWVAESDPSLAWLLLVSAVETAAGQWYPIEVKRVVLTPSELLADSQPQLAELLKKCGGQTALDNAALLIADLFKSTDKFLRFLEHFMPGAPVPRPPDRFAAPFGDQLAMRKVLSKVYDVRSKALHAGVTVPPPMCDPPFPLEPDSVSGVVPIAEVPYYVGSFSRGGYWVAADTPLVLNTFEYIVGEALRCWWRWLGTRATAPGLPHTPDPKP